MRYDGRVASEGRSLGRSQVAVRLVTGWGVRSGDAFDELRVARGASRNVQCGVWGRAARVHCVPRRSIAGRGGGKIWEKVNAI